MRDDTGPELERYCPMQAFLAKHLAYEPSYLIT